MMTFQVPNFANSGFSFLLQFMVGSAIPVIIDVAKEDGTMLVSVSLLHSADEF